MISLITSPRIAGVVCAVPQHEERNDHVSLQRFVLATGVQTFRKNLDPQKRLDTYAVHAAQSLLARLGWIPASVDAIYCLTQSPAKAMPPTSMLIARALELNTHCAAFDVNLGCSGYPYALWLGAQAVSAGVRRILLVVGDLCSQFIDPDDPATGRLFGDAVSVTAMEYGPKTGSWIFSFGTDGNDKALVCEHGQRLRMSGADVFSFSLSRVPKLFDELLEASSYKREDLNGALLHQGNLMMLEQLRRKLGVPIPINIGVWGNCSSASIPMLLCDAYFPDRNKWGKVAMLGFGVGLSWAGVIGEFPKPQVADIVEVP